jgi:hypothetical protein
MENNFNNRFKTPLILFSLLCMFIENKINNNKNNNNEIIIENNNNNLNGYNKERINTLMYFLDNKVFNSLRRLLIVLTIMIIVFKKIYFNFYVNHTTNKCLYKENLEKKKKMSKMEKEVFFTIFLINLLI